MKLAQALRQCAQIERMIGEIYESFAELWPTPPLADLWRGLGREERRHGRLLEQAAEWSPNTREESVDAGKIAEMRGLVRGFLAVPPTSLDDAFRTALDLEDLELMQIYRRLVAVVGDLPEVQHSVANALTEAMHHEEPLLATIVEYAEDPALRAQAETLRGRVATDAAAEFRHLPFAGMR